ncbi:MAG: 50S ribosomal protein L20 [Candidatus Pacebacteria bacterium]|nr:50S ribosomal protein L20 [Candidatus Paceibacterota bacterium]
MPRVKRGTTANKKRKSVLKLTKGFKWSRKSKERAAKEALLHALSRSFRGRKERKGDFRKLWQVKIGAAAKENGMSYSVFIKKLKDSDVALNRKMLAEIAEKHPEAFKKIVEEVK